MKRNRLNIFAFEEQKVLLVMSECVCSLRYPECKAHAPYCVVTWPVFLLTDYQET